MVKIHGCSICGYEDFEGFDEIGCPNYDICPSCGCESGYEYNFKSSESRLKELRKEWREERNGDWWNERKKPPEGWNPDEQMKKAGLEL